MKVSVGTVEHTFKMTPAVSVGHRVTISNVDGSINLSAGTDSRLGVVTRKADAGDHTAVRLPSAPTGVYLTDTAITVGSKVYGADNGKVGTTNTNEKIGIALTTTTGSAGEQIEVLHNNGI